MTNNSNKLIGRAKEFVFFNKELGNDEIELALSWMRDEIRYVQVAKAMGKARTASGNVYSLLARGLKLAYKNGIIKNDK